MILPGPDDGKVTVERTKLQGMKDHIIMPLPHSLMPQSEKAAQQVIHFIQKGYFNHNITEKDFYDHANEIRNKLFE